MIFMSFESQHATSISDQQQPRPYLAPYSHITSVTDKQMTTTTAARPLLKVQVTRKNDIG